MKWLIISIAWIAQMVERKVTTLKVKGSILLLDRNLFLIIENFELLEKEFYPREGLNPHLEGHNLSLYHLRYLGYQYNILFHSLFYLRYRNENVL